MFQNGGVSVVSARVAGAPAVGEVATVATGLGEGAAMAYHGRRLNKRERCSIERSRASKAKL